MKDKNLLIEKIKRIKKEKNALILAHNYVVPEIQDLADYVGDSLGLSRKSAESDNELIVFCAVQFMAETASVLAKEHQRVLCPDPNAGCSLSETINAEDLREWKKEYPEAVVVSYVNTSAEVKAESDYCCTSGNALNVVNSIPEEKEILFLPDMFLGSWVQEMTGRKNMHIFPGECHVHASLPPERIQELMKVKSDADFLIHPECGCSTSCMYLSSVGKLNKEPFILSTAGMVKHAKKSNAETFVVATETGILHPLKKSLPNKEFIPASNDMVCQYMKMVTLEKLHHSLKHEEYEVDVEEPLKSRAKKAIVRMLEIDG
tara:strand:+ start:1233 stop:2186 length:954 start_codon:yes stop_codon:yes gene_type:complete